MAGLGRRQTTKPDRVGGAIIHSGWLHWPLLGWLLTALALVQPWLAIPLEADRSAVSLPLVLAGVPSDPRLSYGTAVAACLGLGLMATVSSRGRPSPGTAGLGLAVLVVCLTFVVATATGDWALQQHLRDQAADQTTIFQQLGYAVPTQEPSLMLGAPVAGDWSRLGGGLQLGWFCAAASGLTLLLSGASSLARWARRAGWQEALPVLVSLLVVVGLIGRGLAAGYMAERGGEAARAGDPQAARSSLAMARALDPSLAGSAQYELALGQVLLASGQRRHPLALLADAQSQGNGGNAGQQVAELKEAVSRDPKDRVLVQQLRQASRQLALADDDARPIRAFSRLTVADEYTEGRVLYDKAEYGSALVCFRRVLTLTREANVVSSAYTYISLSEMKLGQSGQARHDLLKAIDADTGYNNSLARSLAAGLYVANKTGDV
jgi:tetratricopeptide (TPR) repeat protein